MKYEARPVPIALDVSLLQRQKQALLRAINGDQQRQQHGDADLLEGVLNMLDHIHDCYDPPSDGPDDVESEEENLSGRDPSFYIPTGAADVGGLIDYLHQFDSNIRVFLTADDVPSNLDDRFIVMSQIPFATGEQR